MNSERRFLLFVAFSTLSTGGVLLYPFFIIYGETCTKHEAVTPYYSRTWDQQLIKFELEFVQFWFYQVQNDLPSERKSFLRVAGLESFEFYEFLTKSYLVFFVNVDTGANSISS